MKLGKLFFVMAAGVFCVGIGVTADSHEVLAAVKVSVSKNEIRSYSGSGVLKIGKNIKSIAVDPTISGKHSISSIKVESGNKYFYVKDGVLFSKDKTKLILYPNMRKNTTYTVPSGVKVIDEYAFAGANIKNVTISSKVSEIGKNAFENCKSLEKVQGEFNTSELLENMFYDCTKLNYFVIPDSVKKIKWDVFYGCKNLKVKIGKNVESISLNSDDYAASYEVDPENKVYKIDDGVWYSKDGTKLLCYPKNKAGEYVLPDTVTDIKLTAGFEENKKLTALILNDKVTEFDIRKLEGCSALEKLVLGASVKEVKMNFTKEYSLGIDSLKEISVSEKNDCYASYGGALYSKDFTKLYFIPDAMDKLELNENVEEIDERIGLDKNNYNEIILPDTNKNFVVKNNVLYDKGMTRIVIFPSVITSYKLPATVNDVSTITSSMYIDDGDNGYDRLSRSACNLESIEADEKSSYFKSKDGILYNNDMTELVLYPQAKKGKYIMPKGIKTADMGVFSNAAGLTELTLSYEKSLSFDGCKALKKVTYSEGVTSVSLFRTNSTAINNIYLPGTLRYISLCGSGRGATVHGYDKTLYYSSDDEYFKTKLEDYVKKYGYKYKSLGKAPGKVTGLTAKKTGHNIKVSWNKLAGADGYKVYYFVKKDGVNTEVTLKSITGYKNSSCSFNKSKLQGAVQIYVTAYKKVNGVKVYSLPVSVKCK